MPVARQSPALALPGARLLLACTLAGLPFLAQALDLGTQGTTYEIIEPDIRQTLIAAAAAADVKKFNDEREASARKFASTRPSFGLVPAGKTETLWIDPSITVQEDIQAPVKQADGSWKWQVLYPKGFRQNPLSVNRPLTAMVFFDPADPEQMTLVARLLRLDSKQFVPISVGTGDLNELSRQFRRPVFYASAPVLARFNVTHSPSMVFAQRSPAAPGGDRIGVLSFAKPFDWRAVAVWDVAAPLVRSMKESK